MKTIDLADVSALGPYVTAGNAEPILVKSHGQTIAAVVPVSNPDELEDLILSRSPEFEAVLQRSQQRLQQEGGLSSDEVRRRLGLSS